MIGSWALLWCVLPVLQSGSHVAVDVLLGAPANVTVPVTVHQRGYANVSFDAAFRSEPLKPPVYWALRVRLVRAGSAWAVELHHDKLSLDDPPSVVQAFEISHGFNLVTLQHTRRIRRLDVGGGVGGVVAHPEIVVRDRRLPASEGGVGGGYHVVGPAVLASVSRTVTLTRRLAAVLEGRATLAPVKIPIADGHVRFTHVAFHLLVGLSGVFRES